MAVEMPVHDSGSLRPKRDARVSQPISAADEAPGVLGSSALILAASVFGCGLNYLFGVYLARALGPTEFGLYALGFSLFNILILFAPLGLEMSVMKFVSQSFDDIKTDRNRQHILAAARMALLFGSAFGVILALSADFLSNEVFGKPGLAPVLFFFAVGTPFAALSSVLLSSLRALHDVRQFVSIKYFVEPVGKFTLAGLMIWCGWGLTGTLGAVLAVLALSVLLTIGCLLRMPGLCSDGNPSDWRRSAPALLAFSFPLAISNLFGVFAPRSDMLFVGAWFSAQDVGVYSAASQTGATIGLILTAFHSAVIPMIGAALAQKDRMRLESLYHFTSRWTLALSLLLFMYLALFGHAILHFFGPYFAKGAPWLTILAAGHLVNSASGPASATLIMAGYPRVIMVNSIVMALQLIGANILLIPRYGPLGAAWGMSLSVSTGSLLCMLEARWLCGVTPFPRSMVKPLCAGAAALGVGAFLTSELVSLSTAVAAFAVTAVFAALLLLFKLEPADRQALRELAQKFQSLARRPARPSRGPMKRTAGEPNMAATGRHPVGRPKVSIVITAYNAERYILASVRTALAQTYPNFEVLVVDDGSSDRTGEICAAVNDGRFRFLNKGRLGRPRALNAGIAAAVGEYIALNDADDLSLPHRLEYSIDFACSHPDLAYLGTGYIKTTLFHDQLPPEILSASQEALSDQVLWPGPATVYRRNMFVNSTLLYPKSTWERLGGYDERLPLSEDYDFQLRALQYGRAAVLPGRTVLWYSNPDSYFKKKSRREQWAALASIRRRAHRLLNLPTVLRFYHPFWVIASEIFGALPPLLRVVKGVRNVMTKRSAHR